MGKFASGKSNENLIDSCIAKRQQLRTKCWNIEKCKLYTARVNTMAFSFYFPHLKYFMVASSTTLFWSEEKTLRHSEENAWSQIAWSKTLLESKRIHFFKNTPKTTSKFLKIRLIILKQFFVLIGDQAAQIKYEKSRRHFKLELSSQWKSADNYSLVGTAWLSLRRCLRRCTNLLPRVILVSLVEWWFFYEIWSSALN